jgi:enamine deaminase RidA (YjgF/YER057c/UK114 family)
MTCEFLMPPGLNAEYPTERSYGYAVRSNDLVFTSGQVARNARGEIVGKGDIAAQAAQVYENLKTLLESAGGTMANVIVTRTSLVDRDHKFAVRPVRARYFPGPNYPTGAVYIVAGLSDPDYLIEVEAIAHSPQTPPRSA